MIQSIDKKKRTRTKGEMLETISPSRLSTWLSCRLKFFFRYLSGIQTKPSVVLRVGTVVHAVLQEWNLARWRKAPLHGEMVATVFNQEWSSAELVEPLEWGDEEETIKSSTLCLIEAYLSATPVAIDERPEGVEVSVEKDLSDRGLPMLVGIIDLVRQGGRILDYKTTGQTPNPRVLLQTTEIQTTTYALLYREATERRETGIELHHLVRLKTPKIVVTQVGPASDHQIDRLLRLIDSYVKGVQSEDFMPSPGLQCVSCEFFNQCREWH